MIILVTLIMLWTTTEWLLLICPGYLTVLSSYCLIPLQDAGPICLLDKCEPIFEELEDHQVLFIAVQYNTSVSVCLLIGCFLQIVLFCSLLDEFWLMVRSFVMLVAYCSKECRVILLVWQYMHCGLGFFQLPLSKTPSKNLATMCVITCLTSRSWSLEMLIKTLKLFTASFRNSLSVKQFWLDVETDNLYIFEKYFACS